MTEETTPAPAPATHPRLALIVLVIAAACGLALGLGIWKWHTQPDDNGISGPALALQIQADMENNAQTSGLTVTITDVSCEDTPKIARGKITDCHATIDGIAYGLRVTWDDSEGHFTTMRAAA